MQEPVYVVGYGMIDCLGNNPETCFEKMCDDKDYSSDVPALAEQNYRAYRGHFHDPDSLYLPENVSPKLARRMTNTQKIALHSAKQAIDMANLPHSRNVSVIYSTLTNDTEDGRNIIDTLDNPNKRANPRRLVNRIPDMSASHIASIWQFQGQAACIQSGCSTGLVTIDYAMYLAQENDYVIVGGADAGSFDLSIQYFTEIGATANVSMPFDKDRSGFVMGNGAATMVIMSESMLEKYNAKPIAKLYPTGKANDADDLTSPSDSGRGAKISMAQAMSYVDSVDAVCAHATSTPVGDPIEYKTIYDNVGPVTTFAPKGKIGHTMGAASIIEALYSIEAMKHSTVPYIHNLKECDFDEHNMLPTSNINKPMKRILNNSFGFGGKCMSQVIELM